MLLPRKPDPPLSALSLALRMGRAFIYLLLLIFFIVLTVVTLLSDIETTQMWKQLKLVS